jgi:hypothetical protein
MIFCKKGANYLYYVECFIEFNKQKDHKIRLSFFIFEIFDEKLVRSGHEFHKKINN